jgi:acyl-CoA dehydrogenase
MIYGDGKFGDNPAPSAGWSARRTAAWPACSRMMNNARLAVGMQGVAIAETAYQKALEFARSAPRDARPGDKGEGMSPIIAHPDVRRMLMT